MRVEQATDDRGRRVAVKRAERPDEAARLRREADLLEVAGHPGLIEVVGLDDGPPAELRSIWVEGTSLADVRSLDVEEVAGVVAAAASTLADLHGAGLVHGAVEPSHVLLDEDGRPVLCGLGSGGLVGERCGLATGDAVSEGSVLDPAADVAGLGALVEFLLSRATGRTRTGAADSLRQLARRAVGPAAGRPTARQLADTVHDAVGGARLPRAEGHPGPEPSGPPAPSPRSPAGLRRPAPAPSRRRPVRLVATAGAGAVVAAVAVAIGGLAKTTGSAQPAPPDTTASPPPSVAPGNHAEPPPRSGLRPGGVAGCPPVEGPLAADVDGDGCADAVIFAAGVVEAAGRRWAVGQEGDIAAVGDWMCVGRRSLAVLRPSTGEVYAFTGWATAEADEHGPVVSRVAGGSALRAADLDGDGCHELVVERSAGAPAVLHPPRGHR